MARGLSIKYKLLILLNVILVGALVAYAYVAIDLFRNDKIVYVYDATSAISSSLAAQVRSEVKTLSSYIRPFISSYVAQTRRFTKGTEENFQSEENVDYLAIYHFDQRGDYRLGARLRKKSFRPQGNWVESATGLDIVRKTAKRGFFMQFLSSEMAIYSLRYGEESDPNHTVLFTILRANNLNESFGVSSGYSSYLIDSTGEVVIGKKANEPQMLFSDWDFFSELRSTKFSGRALETTSPEGESYLVSYSRIGVGGIHVLTLIKKQEALKAVRALLSKSVLFLISILSLSFFISILASNRLTSALRTLLLATQKVADGDYSVKVQVNTKDEVQGLAESFNSMASEVSRLMVENVEKARMEKELETAKTVQDSLFPRTDGSVGNVDVFGYYVSASECGGDWWHYCEIDSKVYLWIGDATGHGVPAALITSAAKSVASLVEMMPSLSPAKIMSMLNNSIHKTSKGAVCMTFFIAAVDKETGEMTYCNASHEPPIRVPNKGEEKLRKMDLEPIMSESYSRLGESLDSKYEDSTMQLNQGDVVLFYTDGVTELIGPDGSMFQERRLLKALLEGARAQNGAKEMMHKIDKDLQEFRQGVPLEDDVTYFIASFQ